MRTAKPIEDRSRPTGKTTVECRNDRSTIRFPPLLVFRGWLVVLLLGLLSTPTRSETNGVRRFLVEVWQSEAGLPQNTVTGIAQTPDGYLWVATLNGLARFDGVRFKVFKPGNTPALASGRLLPLARSQRGGLWIATQE